MQKSDLVQLLLALSPGDRRSLRKFLRSPFHNHREDVALLFDYLENRLEDLASLSREAAFTAAHPPCPPSRGVEKGFDDQQLRRLTNYLLRAVEAYLVHREAVADEQRNLLHLAAAYRRLGLEKHARQTLQAAASKIHPATESPSSSIHHSSFIIHHSYENSYLLEAETLAFSEKTSRTAPRNLQQVNHALDLAYLAKKLRQCCTALSHQAVANVEYDAGLLPLALDYLESAPWLGGQPAIALYFWFYRAATTGEDGYFEKLKAGIFEHGNLFPPPERRNLYLLAINYGIRRFNQGEGRYLSEVFDLYRSALEQAVLLENGELSRFAFKNVAGIALRLGEFDWTERFIHQFSPLVEARHRRNYTDYNLAKLHYARQDFRQALALLHRVEYEDVFLNLDAKILLLKIYFELGELAALDAFLPSFQRFLNRKKELGYHRENYTSTLHFTRRLLEISPFEKVERERLRAEIVVAKAIGEKEWLLERLEK